MRRDLLIAAGAALGLAAIAGAGPAAASCATTGTIVGGVGGALLGGAIGHSAGGAFLGGLGGAVIGHEVGRSSCRHAHYAYYRSYRQRAYYEPGPPGPGPGPSDPGFYYDPYGRPIQVSSSDGYRAPSYWPPAGAACRSETHAFYDQTGTLVQRQVQVCDR